ncbi:hypothetical protein HY440_01340 [Candidatus Microgenomates bacterium]|nr:hypothetical protein [Candidatus Microgenomates bacterium]
MNQTPKAWLGPLITSLKLPGGGASFIGDNIVSFLVSVALFLDIALSLIFLLFGGVRWIVSGGEKESLAKAKSTITYALIGLVLGIGSFLIIGAVSQIFQINLGLGIPAGRQCMVNQADYGKFCLTTTPISPDMQYWCSTVKNDCGY